MVSLADEVGEVGEVVDVGIDGGEGDGAGDVLTVTAPALAVVLDAMAQEPKTDKLALWVEVTGARESAYAYDIYFQSVDDASGGDVRITSDGLTVVVPESSVERVRGARLDWSDEGEGGLVMLNPNTPPRPDITSPPRQGDLSSDTAQLALAILEEQVNPSIAMHGGRADLVAVEEGVAYVRLSGGCQGCGLATVTLSQGIEVALVEGVAEIVSVVDVTDHTTGNNPYYEPAKK